MDWLKTISNKNPLIECLTNDVTINEVANMILAVGGSPVMATEPMEIPDFVRLSSAVVINIGTVRQENIHDYETAMDAAAAYRRPVVFDPVGAGAATFRTELALRLLSTYPCTIIRGNSSEIHALNGECGHTSGVDVSPEDVICDDNIPSQVAMASQVARHFSCIVSMSGAIDVITDGKETWLCRNGVPWMSRVTGTGCSLTGITAVFAAVVSEKNYLEAAATATAMMGISGELAYTRTQDQGLGAFRCALVNALSMLTDPTLTYMKKLEFYQ